MDSEPESDPASTERARRIQEALAEYRASRSRLSRDEFLARYRELMPELEDALRRVELVQRAGDQAQRDPLWAALETLDSHGWSAESLPDPIRETLDSPSADGPVGSQSRQPATGRDESAYNGRATRYWIRQLHGQGGLGNVWLARDEDLKRDVALKELRAERADQQTALRAFLREAQITGQLEHPNIVPVYQLGKSEDNHPFYSMRLVRGQTLRAAISALHQQAKPGPPPAMELRRLLTALVSVCNAVAYAHSRGVIHRDLKSDNVVLGEFGEVIVVDWGLAKVMGQPEARDQSHEPDQSAETVEVEQSVETRTIAGQFRGTPAYMAPEQARGETDLIAECTDVYGLGAMLFEILLGRPPHHGSDIQAMLARIAAGPQPRPRERNATIDRALDAICAKAMSQERHQRYASATELAQDLERWLADQPVSAYAEPLITRLGRWGRRHKTLVAGTASLMLTAVIGLAISTAIVRQQQLQTERQRQRAAANLDKARDAVDRMLTEFAEDHLEDVPFHTPVQRRLLEHAHQLYQDFAHQIPENVEVGFEAAQASYRVGEIRRLLGEHRRAREAYREAISRFEQLRGLYPDHAALERHLAQSLNYLGESHRLTSQPDKAFPAYDRALEIQKRLVIQFPGRRDFRQELARTHYNLGLALAASNQGDRAEAMYREAITQLEALVSADPAEESFRHELARAKINFGVRLKETERPLLAEQSYARAIELLSELVQQRPQRQTYQHALAVAHVNLGNLLLSNTDRRVDTGEAYLRGSEILEQLSSLYPSVAIYRHELANSINSLGGLHFFANDFATAEETWNKAAQPLRDLIDAYPQMPEYRHQLGGTLSNMAWARIRQDELPGAVRLAEEGIELQREALRANPDNPVYKRALRDAHWAAAEAQLGMGHHLESASHAEQMHHAQPDSESAAFQAATLLARAISAANADEELAGQSEVAERYRQLALELLEDAFRRGFRDAGGLLEGPEFQPLRDDPQFRELMRP